MLERKVDKAFPHARWGTNSDAYAYKRVGPHLRVSCPEHTCCLHRLGCWPSVCVPGDETRAQQRCLFTAGGKCCHTPRLPVRFRT